MFHWSNQARARRYTLASFAVLLVLAPQWNDRPSTVPERQQQHWQLIRNWPISATGARLGQVSGIDIDTSGHVMVFHRAGGTFDRAATEPRRNSTVFELDPTSGALLNEWGADRFVLPHSLTVDRSNNVWLTDDILHQVMKFSHDGRLLLTVGTSREPGWDSTHFNEPTDIVIATDGSFYVSDGYQNSRIAHFEATGRFLGEWGSRGGNGGQFRIPHGITIGVNGDIYVADRENRRLQVFTKSGAIRGSWPTTDSVGRVFDIAVSPRGYVYLAIRISTTQSEVRILDRKFREVGRVLADSSVLTVPHQIAVQGDSVLYIADTNGERVLKYARQ